jgi:hypothetical protein
MGLFEFPQGWEVAVVGNDGLRSGIFPEYPKGKERYFMTQEDQHAVIGRIVMERRDAETRLAALREEAYKFGEMFSYLGQMLKEMPESIEFENLEMPLDFQKRGTPLFKQADINPQKIYQLIKDIRDTLLTLKRIGDKAKQLGI